MWSTFGLALLLLATPARSSSSLDALVEGHRHLAQGRPQAATSLLARAAADTELPVRDLALLLWARAELAAGRPEDAAAIALRAARAVPDGVRSADARWVRAEALEAAGRHAGAADAWRDFLERHPSEGRVGAARVRQAASWEAAGDAAAAVAAWRRAALEWPADAPPEALRTAEALARRAGVPWVPPTGAELLTRADALRKANLHRRAVTAHREAEAALGITPRGELATVRRARSHYLLRENDAAREACEELVRRNPASEYATVCLHVRARVAWRAGDDEAVLALTREALDDPRHRASSWRDDLLYVRAGFFMEKERWDEAVATWETLLRDHGGTPNADQALWKAAWSRHRQGRHGEAVRLFDRVHAQAGDRSLREAGAYWAARATELTGDVGGALARWRAAHLDSPFSFYGQRSRDALAARSGREALAALDDEVESRGSVFAHPGAPDLSTTAPGRRHALLVRASADLADLALPELEAHRRLVGDSDALVFALARARLAAGGAAEAYRLIARRFWQYLAAPSRRSDPALWEIVYPRPLPAVLSRHASRHALDPALVAALIRSESWWQADVRSTADARGLMQLIPPTARRLARDEGWADFDPDRLFEPEVNLRLGTRYLAELLDRFGGDEAAAVAAYNAGEDAVETWWVGFRRDGVTDPVERIERIPYRETRPYVKRVLEAAGWYRWLGAGAGTTSPSADPAPAPSRSGSD